MEEAFRLPYTLNQSYRNQRRDTGKNGIIPEERRVMKKLSSKKKIRQIKMLNKNLRKMNLRKSKRVKDEKKAAERERTLPRNR